MYNFCIDEIDKQELLQGKICFLGSLAQILQLHRIVLAEEAIYGLGFGLGFRLMLNENNDYIDMDCIDIITDFEKCKVFLNSMDIEIFLKCVNSEKEFAELLEQNRQQPVLADIDSFHLNYGSTYKLKHNAHIVVLTNIDNQNVLIQDNYVSKLIPGKQSMKARKSDILKWCNLHDALPDCSFRYLMCTFRFGGTEVKLSKERVIKYIKDIKNEDILKKKLEYTCQYEGIVGLEKLLELFDRYEKMNFNDEYTLKKIHERLSAHGGLYQSRKLYAYFIRWYGKMFEVGEIQKMFLEIADSMEEIADIWRKISAIILKNVLQGKVPDWKGISARASNSIIEEKKLIAKFEMLLEF